MYSVIFCQWIVESSSAITVLRFQAALIQQQYLQLIMNHAANRLAFVHQLKRMVDFVQRHGVGDKVAQRKFAVHVLLDNPRQFAAPFYTAKG